MGCKHECSLGIVQGSLILHISFPKGITPYIDNIIKTLKRLLGTISKYIHAHTSPHPQVNNFGCMKTFKPMYTCCFRPGLVQLFSPDDG